MAKRVSVDRWLFTVTMLLVFVGLVMVFSASAVMARERFGSEYAFLSKQLMWAAAGLAAMVVAMRVDYRRYQHPALVFSLLGLTTLLLISVFFLDRSHNTHRWIHWRVLVSAIGTGQAGADSVSRVFSRRPREKYRRLAQHAGAGRRARGRSSRTDRAAA